MPALYTLRRY